MWVRRLSYQSAVGDIQAIKTDGELAAARIASCIVDHRGELVFCGVGGRTVAEAQQRLSYAEFVD